MRRTLRVYGPYLAAIAMSIAGYSRWHHHAYHGVWAQNQWSESLTLRGVLQHVAFIGVYDWHQINFVIWSLIQEMRISIIFPILVMIVMRIGSVASILLGAFLSVIALQIIPQVPDLSAHYSLGITVHYIAFFLAGIVLASRLGKIERCWNQISPAPRALLAILALFAYVYAGSISTFLLRILRHGDSSSLDCILILANWISAVGAAGLMIVGLHAISARRVLNTSPVRFLGVISYSLYLVHPLVLFAITFSCGNRVSAWLQFPLYIGVALLVAWLFNLAVEKPFTRLSRAV